MKRKGLFIFLFFQVLLLMMVASVSAQDRKAELENTKKRIEEEISLTNQLLEETRKTRQTTMSELNMLQTRIRQRENLLATIKKQLIDLDNQIGRTQRELNRTQQELNALRKEYARMISFAYKNRSGINKLMFLFASDDFNQAYRRLKYLQQYSAMRQTQISRIAETQQRLEERRTQLAADKEEKTKLFEAERKQQILLSNEKMSMDLAVQKISRQERDLQQTIRQKQQDARKLQREIENIIAEEIRRARQQQGDRTTSPDRLMMLTPEEQKLSASFTQNKGKLPWPVERGVISSRFGEQPHPVLKKVTIKNNGIDIATTRGSEARVVFDGVVVSTNRITATNNAVIVRHGDFFTVYSNLEQVFVKRGDQLKTKDPVGLIHTDRAESKTELHFEIWQNRTIVDPAHWLAR